MPQGVFLLTVAWNILLTALFFYLWFFLRKFFPQKKRGLTRLIEDNLNKNKILENRLNQLEMFLNEHKLASRAHYQKIGVVRFNPFERVGGEQSYSLAILDEKNDGLVITFLYSREGVRVYVKRVVDGHGKDVELSKEEEKAIVMAR